MFPSSSFPPFLAILVIVIVTIFIVWSSIAIFSEGQKETPSIKITSPTTGQKISTGSNLTISGIATDSNTSTARSGNSDVHNRCYVSVIVNNIKPYHNATAGGPNGVDDYSKWHYTLLAKYAPITEGQNKLTGRLSCLPASGNNANSNNTTNATNNLDKWYSVNVTGVSISTVNRNNHTVTNSTTQPQPQQQQSKTEGNTTITSNSSAITNATHSNSKTNSSSPSIAKENNSNKIATSSGSVPAKLTHSPSTDKSTSSYNYNNNAKPLSISIQSSQNIVNGRGASTITATVYDVVTGKKIDNAIVKLKITFTSNGTSKEIVRRNGEVTYSAKIKPNSKDSSNISFRTTVQASAPGYISTSKTTTSSSLSSMSTSNSNHQESIIDNKGTDNLTQDILKNVQKKLKQNGIDIALGK